MSAELKILKFVGVDKKEQVLLKSFLNLAKDELEYELQIDESHASPDVVVMDEEHVESGQSYAANVLKITIGNSSDNASESYINRPLQWSRFKSVLDKLDEVQAQQPVQSQPTEQPAQAAPSKEASQVVSKPEQPPVQQQSQPEPKPANVQPQKQQQSVQQQVPAPEQQQAVQQTPQPVEQQAPPVQQTAPPPQPVQSAEQEVVEFFPGTQEHDAQVQFSENVGEWELEVSIEPDAESSSEKEAVPEDELGQLYALNDNSLESPSEFLDNIEEMVIETDKVDEWDEKSATTEMSESEGLLTKEKSSMSSLNNLLDTTKTKQEDLVGDAVGDEVKFWSGDLEVLLNNHPVFVIREKRGTVYTEYEPYKWYKIIGSGGMRKRKLDSKWKPYGRLESYPIEWLMWCAYITRSKGVLTDGINKKDLFLLEKWPDFSLLQNDNNLLKLCSLAFANPESPRSLVVQSKLRARVVVGFINACNAMKLLSRHGNEDGDNNAANNGQASSMTWFKDLFK